MEIIFDEIALKDLSHWKKSGNAAVQEKIKKLLLAIQQSPYSGIGKPEPLKYSLTGKWSRRINGEHRIVYQIKDDQILIFSLRGHYL